MAGNVTGSASKWAVLSTVLVGVFMAMIDSSVVNVALPTMVGALHTDFASIQWVPLSYMLTVTCLMMLVGRLADLWGKRAIYAAGYVVFTMASLLCGLASGLETLIASRVLQGVGAATIMAIGPAVLVETFPPRERGRAIGITGSVVSLGIILGPTVGGMLLKHAGWSWIFFLNLPLGVLGTILVLRLVSPARPERRERFDLLGAFTLSLALLGLLLGLTVGQKPQLGAAIPAGLFALGAVALATFLYVELKAPSPLVDLRLFRNGTFSANLAASFLSFITVAGTVVLMPFYLQDVLKADPQSAGLALAAMPVVLGVVAPIAGSLSDRHGTARVSAVGLVFVGLGFLLLRTLNTETSLLGYVLRFLPVGLGLGLFQSPNNSAILGSAPRERMGVASGLLAVARTLGQTTGIAVLTAVWAGRVTARLGAVPPGGVSRAPTHTQVLALQDTLLVILLLTAASLFLVVTTAVVRARQAQPAAASAVRS
jgi:EmrB/QacA subfamily drug resistance transporter